MDGSARNHGLVANGSLSVSISHTVKLRYAIEKGGTRERLRVSRTRITCPVGQRLSMFSSELRQKASFTGSRSNPRRPVHCTYPGNGVASSALRQAP